MAWHISNLPLGTTSADVAAALFAELVLGAGPEEAARHKPPSEYTVHLFLGGPDNGVLNGGRFCFVDTHDEETFAAAADATARLLSSGVLVRSVRCPAKRRRESKAERLAKLDREMAAKLALASAAVAKRPVWQPAMLERFPRRESTLDAHAMVAELPADLKSLIADVYLPLRFPPQGVALNRHGVPRTGGGDCVSCVVSVAMRYVWEAFPKSLRVKELFETVETYTLIANQIQLIRARSARARRILDEAAKATAVAAAAVACAGETTTAAAAMGAAAASSGVPGEGWGASARNQPRRVSGGARTTADARAAADAHAVEDALEGVEVIYDVACGHGLLGILLAGRFPNCRVVCVDLELRECFGHYLEGFRAAMLADAAAKGCKVSGGEASSPAPPPLPLANVSFVVGDMAQVLPAPLPPRSFVACVHGCNEANLVALAIARGTRAAAVSPPMSAGGGGGSGEGEGGGRAGPGTAAAFAVMPCCVRGGLYGPRSVRHLGDDARHALQCGAMASSCGAHSVTCVERAITNRQIILFGGYRFPDDSTADADCGGGGGDDYGGGGGNGHGSKAVSARRVGNWNGGVNEGLTLSEWERSQHEECSRPQEGGGADGGAGASLARSGHPVKARRGRGGARGEGVSDGNRPVKSARAEARSAQQSSKCAAESKGAHIQGPNSNSN